MTALRPDQLALVADYDAVRAQGHRCVVLQGATGFGKSVVIAYLAARALPTDPRPGTIVVVSHLGEINRALVEHLTRAGCPEPYLYGHAGDPASPVVVVSAQAVEAGGLHFPACREMFVDEGHRAGAASYERFIASHLATGARVTLATATPARSDGKPLPHATAIVQGPQVRELVAAGRLAPVTVIGPRGHKPTLADDPVELYPAGRPGIVFAASVPHSIALAQQFTGRGIPAQHVDGTQHPTRRAEILDNFMSGRVQVLTCYRLFAEGVDAPRAEVCVLASSVGSTVTYLQAVGRVRRPREGKRALVLDLCGSTELHEHPDLDRTYHVDGQAIRVEQGPRETMPVQCRCGAWGMPRSTCEVCGADRPGPKPPKVEKRPVAEILAGTSEDGRFAKYERWVIEGAARGYKAGWAANKYKAAFREWPRAGWLARILANEAPRGADGRVLKPGAAA